MTICMVIIAFLAVAVLLLFVIPWKISLTAQTLGLFVQAKLSVGLYYGLIRIPVTLRISRPKDRMFDMELRIMGLRVRLQPRRKPKKSKKRNILKALYVKAIHIRFSIGVEEDAALNALLCGIASTFAHTFFGFMKNKFPLCACSVVCQPLFNQNAFNIRLQCIANFHFVHIITDKIKNSGYKTRYIRFAG
ncbi:MAG: hypothetical protein ACOYJC_04045 [Christensenellales bacterium]